MKPALEKLNINPNETVFDGIKEPPMPNMLLNYFNAEGIDTDKNGIRDDIDIWINRTGENYNERMALRQAAHSEQNRLLTCLNNKIHESSTACQKSANSLSCLNYIIPRISYYLDSAITELTFNNNSRKNCHRFYKVNSCSSNLSNVAPEKKCNFHLK
jgi:hypothetical protein